MTHEMYLCVWREISSYCYKQVPSLHNAAAPISVSEVFETHETDFFSVVNPQFSLLRLQRKGVITQDVASRISAATNEQDAQEILFAHLSHSANVNTLREYCEVIIAADGLPMMQSFGRRMKEELQQGGWLACTVVCECVVCCVRLYIGVLCM